MRPLSFRLPWFPLLALITLFGVVGCGKKVAPQPVYTVNPAPLPSGFAEALEAFRPEGTRGWTFVQETQTRSDKIVEKHDATKPEFNGWTLLEKNGRPPNEEETKEYVEMLGRRPRSDNAPNVRDQILRDSWKPLPTAADGLERFQFNLKPGAEDDHSAAYMVVVFAYDPASRTVLEVELRSQQPFRPTFGVSITEAHTRVRYHAPQADRPVLIRDIEVKVRGDAFWLRKLDQDMTVTYRDYAAGTSAK